MQTSILAYIDVYGQYTPLPSLVYIYIDAIYMFAAFFWMLVFIMLFAYTILACCKLVVLHQLAYAVLDVS